MLKFPLIGISISFLNKAKMPKMLLSKLFLNAIVFSNVLAVVDQFLSRSKRSTAKK